MTKAELQQKRAALLDANSAVLATAGKESRELTAEERTSIKANLDAADVMQADIDMFDRQAAASANLNANTTKRVEVVKDNRTAQPFATLGEQLCAIAAAADPEGSVDPRLYAAPTGANESLPGQGGFLVQQDLVPGLLLPAIEASAFASRCRTFQAGANSNGIKINTVKESSRASTRWGGVLGYWLAEAGTKQPTKPEFAQIELSLKKVAGLFWATDELLQDAVALNSVITECFPSELAFQLDDRIVRGNGVGVPLGILASPARVTVAKEVGQGADTITYENLTTMYSRMPGRLRPGAAWFYNQEIEPQLFTLGLTLGMGGAAVWLPPGGLSGSPYATLFGRPMIPTELASALGDEGDIIFANMSEYALLQKGGVQTASSIHVHFTTDETVFRFVLRVDGQPLWSTTLTPYKGSAALSPFVTLADRA